VFKMIEALGSNVLERFVPRIDASAAAQDCWTEWKCVIGTSGCNATDHTWWQTRTACSSGSTTAWKFHSCSNCR
jgi:hypothetical protein